MNLISRQQRLLDIIDLVYEVSDCEQMVRALFAELRGLLGFSSGVLLPIDAGTFEMQGGHCFDCPEENTAPYLQHYAPFDPFLRRPPDAVIVNQTVRLSDIASPSDLGHSEFADFMRMVPYRHALEALAGFDGQPLAAFSVRRCKNERDFGADEMAVLDPIARHLGRALALRRWRADPAVIGTAGLLVFGASGRLLFRNEVARRLIPSNTAAAVLAALPPAGSGGLRLGFQRYRVGRLPWRAASLLTPLALHDARENMLDGNDGGGASEADWAAVQRLGASLTIVSLLPYRRRDDVCSRLEHYGLSPRELEITAQKVLSGLTNAQLGQSACISEDTVKSHLRAAYRKIGVGSRLELLVNLFGLDGQSSPLSDSDRCR